MPSSGNSPASVYPGRLCANRYPINRTRRRAVCQRRREHVRPQILCGMAAHRNDLDPTEPDSAETFARGRRIRGASGDLYGDAPRPRCSTVDRVVGTLATQGLAARLDRVGWPVHARCTHDEPGWRCSRTRLSRRIAEQGDRPDEASRLPASFWTGRFPGCAPRPSGCPRRIAASSVEPRLARCGNRCRWGAGNAATVGADSRTAGPGVGRASGRGGIGGGCGTSRCSLLQRPPGRGGSHAAMGRLALERCSGIMGGVGPTKTEAWSTVLRRWSGRPRPHQLASCVTLCAARGGLWRSAHRAASVGARLQKARSGRAPGCWLPLDAPYADPIGVRGLALRVRPHRARDQGGDGAPGGQIR